MPQLEGLLSPQAREDWKLLRESAPELKAAIDLIVASNAKLQKSESTSVATTKELNQGIEALAKANKALALEQKALLDVKIRAEKLTQLQTKSDKEAKAEIDSYIKSVKDGAKELEKLAAQREKIAKQAEARAKNSAEKEAYRQEQIAAKELQKSIKDLDAERKLAQKEIAAEQKEIFYLSNAYNALSRQHQTLEKEAQHLGASLGIESKEFMEVAARANEAGNKLKAIDASLGNHRRNVGNYASAWNGLQFSVTQIVRELPSLANGLAIFASAIGNNLPQAVDEYKKVVEANKALAAQGKPTTSAIKQVIGAIVGWQTALIILLTLFAAYGKEIQDFITHTSKADAALKSAKEASIKAFKQEEEAIKVWKVQVDDSTTSQQRLLQIKDELIKKYPGTKAIIESETNLQEGLNKAIEKVSGALLIQARIRAYANAIAETETKQLLNEMSGIDVVKGGVLGAFLGVGAGAASATSDVVKQYDATLKILNKKLLESVKEFQKTGGDVLLGTPKDKAAKREKELKDQTNSLINSIKKRLDAELKLDEQSLNIKQQNAKRIFEDEEETLKNRLEALETYYATANAKVVLENNSERKALEEQQAILIAKQKKFKDKKIKLTSDEQKILKNNISQTYTEIQALDDKQNAEFLDNSIEAEKKRIEIVKKYGAEQVQAVLANLKAVRANSEGTGSKRGDREKVIKDQISYLEEFRDILASEGVNVDFLTEKINELNGALSGIVSTPLQRFADILKSLKPVYEELKGLINDIYSHKLAALDREEEKIKENGAKEVESLKNQALTAEQREKRIQIAVAKTEAQEQQIEARRKQTLIQQAKFNRAVSIAEIIANTAKAVVVALTEGDPYTKAIRAALAGALGAAQIARVVATPLPSYAEGTKDHPGGLARFGEAGTELVKEPGKKPYLATKETIADLPQHTKIFNEEQMRMMFLNPALIRNIGESDSIELLRSDLNKGLNNVVKAVKNKDMNVLTSIYGIDNYIRTHTKRM